MPLEDPGHREFGKAGVHQGDGLMQSRFRYRDGALNMRQFGDVLHHAEGLHQITRGAPRPACALLQETSKIGMGQMGRLKTDPLDAADSAQVHPEPAPEAAALDPHPGGRAELLFHLRGIPIIGEEHRLQRRNHQ